MTQLLKTLVAWLAEGSPAICATIVAREGSTPRAAGSRMIVRGDGVVEGTVGGGVVEARVLNAAMAAFGHGKPGFLEFDLTGELAAGADMVCGGRLRVFLERLDPGDCLTLFRELLQRSARGERCLLAVPLGGGPRVLVAGDAGGRGRSLPDEVLEASRAAGASIRAPMAVEAGGDQWILIPWDGPSPLVIAGAGHVARFTAHIAAMVGFAVTVVDDRPEFANPGRFPEAREILVQDLRTCLEGRSIGPETSVVILTRGHVHDAGVLAQALTTRAGYIGMIGSRRKRDAIYAHLRGKGFGDGDFSRVRCPVGVPIDAETPEEIGVSIVAELIQARARRALS